MRVRMVRETGGGTVGCGGARDTAESSGRGPDLGAADWNSIVGSSGYVELECLDGPSDNPCTFERALSLADSHSLYPFSPPPPLSFLLF